MQLTEERIKNELEGLITPFQIDALLERRKKLLEAVEKEIDTHGWMYLFGKPK